MADEIVRNPGIYLRHRVIELFGVDAKLLDDRHAIEEKLSNVTKTLNLIIWNIFTHKFSLGVTSLAVISDSHIAIHTWPEYGYVHLDVITCSEKANWDLLMPTIEQEFAPKHTRYKNLDY